MSLVQIDWKPNSTELRKFGVTMLVGFGLIGAFLWWNPWGPRPTAATVCWAFGALAGILGLTGTKAALPVYWFWMGIGFVMGNIISRLILMLFFYGIITPIGLVMRASGRDKLELRKPSMDSYWKPMPPTPETERYSRQF